MKAMVLNRYGSVDDLELKDIAKPIPSAGEVLVKIHATAINDWDWCLVRGTPFYMRLLCGLFKPKVQIPGAEISGRVEATGPNTTKFSVGDAVYGDISESGLGGFAEYICISESVLAHKPDSMSFIEATALPHAAMLALQGLVDEGQLKSRQKILINGAGGGVGTLAVQIAHALGVTEIIGVDHTSKMEMMNSIGFTHTIDYTQTDFTALPQKYDLILDTKTNRPLSHYLRVLNPGGTYATVGGLTLRLLPTFILGPIIRRLTGKKICLVALKPNKDLDYIAQLFESGQIKPILDGPYPFHEIPRLIQYFGEGKHQGKVVVSLEQ